MLHGRRNLPFFGNFEEKASCVDDKTVLFRYTNSLNVFQKFASNPYHNVIRPYQLKNGQNPYCMQTIRTRWHVCLNDSGNVAKSNKEKPKQVNRNEIFDCNASADGAIYSRTMHSAESMDLHGMRQTPDDDAEISHRRDARQRQL